MLGHQERTALLLLLGVAITVIAAHLILAAMGNQPFARPFSSDSADGELVYFSGSVAEATATKNGGHILLKMDNITVFIPARVAGDRSFAKGSNLTLYGTVQTYHGKKELVVNSAGDLKILP